jgi:hypothetical protein
VISYPPQTEITNLRTEEIFCSSVYMTWKNIS